MLVRHQESIKYKTYLQNVLALSFALGVRCDAGRQ